MKSSPRDPTSANPLTRKLTWIAKKTRLYYGNYRNAFASALIPYHRRPKSVYFFTFHKCASTLFSSLVLKQTIGLRNIDYAYNIWQRKIQLNDPVTFLEKGYVYGPIRISSKVDSLLERFVLEPVLRADFLQSRRAVFLIRDPRAILTSQYYSFGFSHPLSRSNDVHNQQLRTREEIQKLTVDQYVLDRVSSLAEAFNRLAFAKSHCQESVLLRYEDLVDNFDAFIESLCSVIPLRQQTIAQLYQESRPKRIEDQQSHKRSGLPKGFRKYLMPQTIDALNQRLATILVRYGYDP
jgi:hypothetical protein